MNLYLANGTYVGTQADARKLDKGFKPVTVPTDKDGLIDYLNGLARAPASSSAAAPHMAAERPYLCGSAVDHIDGDPRNNSPENLRFVERRDMSATAVLSRMDGPPDIDALVETICKSSGYPLKRFAAAVAVAFQNLESGGR